MNFLLLIADQPEAVCRQYYDGLREGVPGIKIDFVDSVEKLRPFLPNADVLIGFGAHLGRYANDVVQRATQLKWIQVLGSGVDNISDLPSLRKDVLITNVRGVHGAPLSEAALAAMLALSRGLLRNVKNQALARWERHVPQLLHTKTVGILGVGATAEALAPRCKALGMKVIGITRSRRELASFDRIVDRHEIESIVGELDYLVLLVPLTDETRDLIGMRVLRRMKPTGFLINLARGGILDERALIEALHEKLIAGAALDVFATEPLPEGHPFWKMENVLVTPHLGGLNERYPVDVLPTVIENVRLFLRGDVGSMLNVVNRQQTEDRWFR